jgi:hypothetical protein
VVGLSSQSIFLFSLVLGGDNFISMESRPWNPPVAYCGLPGFFSFKTRSYLRQLERSRSFAVIYASSRCVCDDKAPDHAWLHAISESKLIPRLAERIRKIGSCAGARTNQGAFRLLLRRTRDGAYHRRESRNPTDLYVCVSLGSRSICPGGPTKVDEQVGCGIGIVSHARIHSGKEVCSVWFEFVTYTF